VGVLILVVLAGGFNLRGADAVRLPVVSAVASADDGNVPANTLDGLLATRWSANGDGQWIHFDLGTTQAVGSVKIAWHSGNLRQSNFEVQTSGNGSNWTTVLSSQSSGTTTALENYPITQANGRHVRVLGHGNSVNLWNSIAEVEVYSPGDIGTSDPRPRLKLNRASLPNGQRVTLDWNASAGAAYQVQVSSNLVNWADIGAPITNAAATQTWQEDLAGATVSTWPVRYYRVKQGVAITPPPPTNTPLPTIQKTLATLQIGSKGLVHYRNRPLNVYDPRVTRAIIVVHGSGANASGYFDRMNNVIPTNMKENVMVIAPHFQESAEAGSGEYWWDGDWREGGASGGLGSYDAVDYVVELLRNRGNFPNLKWVVIGGHSAGGQYSVRYAAFTDIDMKPWPNAEFVKFVPANPSSYGYLNEYRRGPNNTWIIPQECSGEGYNDWKYGMDGLYGYTAARGAAFARTNLPRRWVELLAGTFDNVVDDGLDLDCGAMRQGERRFDRAQNFDAFMDHYYPGNNFSMTLVPEVGHDSELIFASPEGRAAYFFAD